MTRGHSPWADAADLLDAAARIVFDVGANVGQTATEVLAAFREATLAAGKECEPTNTPSRGEP